MLIKLETNLYEATGGKHPTCAAALAVLVDKPLNHDPDALLAQAPLLFPRFRDAFFDVKHSLLEGPGIVVTVLTRTGGSNRPDYKDANQRMMQHPLFIADADDPDDTTYAHWFFNVPPALHKDAQALLHVYGTPVRLRERLQASMERFNRGERTPGFQKIADAIQQLQNVRVGAVIDGDVEVTGTPPWMV